VRRSDGELDAFVSNESSRVRQAGSNIVQLQPRILTEEYVRRVAGGEHAEDVFDREPVASDDRLTAENTRVSRNACQQVVVLLRHDVFILARGLLRPMIES
jgi:hypothetical protein